MKSFESWRRERLGLMWWLIALYMMVAVAVALTGCAPRVTQDVRSVRTDTVYVGHTERDSVYLHDSLYIHEYARGETIYVDRTRWREYFVDRWKRDTVYESRVDTCVVYREVIKEPEKKKQRTILTLAGFGLLLLLIYVYRRII